MPQFIPAALVALGLQIAPPADAQVLAALPEGDAPRTDVSVVTSAVERPPAPPGAERPARQWAGLVFYTETVGGVRIRRVQVVYLERAGGAFVPVR